MKPSKSVLLGAIVVTGGWMSVSSVAFAGEVPQHGSATVRANAAQPVANQGAVAASDAAVCTAGQHGHGDGSPCACAHCAGQQAD